MLLKKLGKYEILEWLGGGRFGDVFLARDTIIDKNFALKISRMRREEVTMLKDEARLLASLNHPNIVRFYNIDIIEGKFVMVMEYIEGNNLRDIITEGGIEVRQSTSIIVQVLDALVYAHGNNVLHRDLKPENILITTKDDTGTVKITDFGLAKFIRSGSISASSAGTPIYMAPETWSGSFSEKSDIWSLGITLYELLTGVPPFLDDTLEGLKRKIEKTKFLAPGVLRHDIPEYIEEIISSTLAANPRSRLSAKELTDKIIKKDKAVRGAKHVRLPQKKTASMQLTPGQEEVLEAVDGSVLLLGQAGCGKTTTLTHAVNTLLERGVPISKILICTFTNKAATDIRERLKNKHLSRYELWLGTFHTIGFRILRRDAERLDISEDFVIKEPKRILREMQVKVGKYRINTVLRFIQTLKARGITPQMFKPQNAWEKSCHDIYQKYQEYTQEKSILDYDDLILFSIELLQEHDDIRQYYRDLFDYIFVDELQDINPAQYKMMSLLYKNRIFFTGDADQAIYGWRGAERELIYRIPKDYTGTKIFNLNKSFRLAQDIIEIANNLMHREATIIPGADPSDVFVYAAKSEQDEADYITKEIKILRKKNISYGDIVILYRMNYLSRFYEEALIKARIPHALIGGSSFYERADVKPVIEYLELLDEGSPQKIDLETFLARANSIFKTTKKNQKRATIIHDHHFTNAKMLGPKKIIEDIIDLSGMKGANIDELHALASSFKTQDLTSFLNEIRLIQELDLVDWGRDAVKLMTIHSAKGLEFPVVFVVDLAEDLFPLTKKMSSKKEIEEERRLCYVALTRAQKKLYLLYPKWRQGRYQHPSRFLVEMFKTTL
ncbi:UvrD-helicase domain-containing protein [candidate division WOR-3 bacterium]|nr:UvrD-helicase domain-containing protein [candidate division WOR-3 bacterium]